MIEMGNDVVRLSLKVWNWAMGVGGLLTIIYAVLMFRVSQSSSSSHHITIPWFFHAILFVGIVLCALTLLGHLAATTANNCCLATVSIQTLLLLLLLRFFLTLIITKKFWVLPLTQRQYIVVVLLLLIFETVIMAHAFLDPTWEKLDVPVVIDSFDDFTDSLVSTYIWKILASLVFLTQAICILLAALSIREMDDGHESEYEDDEEHRLPLLDTGARWQQDERQIAIL